MPPPLSSRQPSDVHTSALGGVLGMLRPNQRPWRDRHPDAADNDPVPPSRSLDRAVADDPSRSAAAGSYLAGSRQPALVRNTLATPAHSLRINHEDDVVFRPRVAAGGWPDGSGGCDQTCSVETLVSWAATRLDARRTWSFADLLTRVRHDPLGLPRRDAAHCEWRLPRRHTSSVGRRPRSGRTGPTSAVSRLIRHCRRTLRSLNWSHPADSVRDHPSRTKSYTFLPAARERRHTARSAVPNPRRVPGPPTALENRPAHPEVA